jgi:hypothetical protein
MPQAAQRRAVGGWAVTTSGDARKRSASASAALPARAAPGALQAALVLRCLEQAGNVRSRRRRRARQLIQ